MTASNGPEKSSAGVFSVTEATGEALSMRCEESSVVNIAAMAITQRSKVGIRQTGVSLSNARLASAVPSRMDIRETGSGSKAILSLRTAIRLMEAQTEPALPVRDRIE